MLKHLFNANRINLQFKIKTALAFTFFVLLITTMSCGKRKPPIPPSERVSQRVEISGFQKGNQIILSWRMPGRNAPDGNVQNIVRADIYRLAEPADSPLVLSEGEFISRSTLIAAQPIKNEDFALQKLSYSDTLQFAGQSARLRYAVRLVNASGQKAAFSNFLLIETTAKIPVNPDSLIARVSDDAINLNWKAPTVNIDGSQPVNLLGYNVYRSESSTESGKLLNKTPVNQNLFADSLFEFGNEYFYFVRAVAVGNNGELVESAESNIIKIFARDNFAPSPPGAITIAAAPNNISIFFAVNPEKDIAGYRVYRSENPNLPKAEWFLLTNEILTINVFQDAEVESGKTYYYYLTAVDKNGNVSLPSVVVYEKAP